MEFRILGPLEVRADGRAVALPGAKPRAVLAVLLLHANRPVSGERLAVALWGEDAPARAVNTVQVHVSRLRKALGDADVLATTPAGYVLRIDPDQLDANRFERRVADGRSALEEGHARDAASVLEEALSLWRGRPFDDVGYAPFAQREVARLEDLRVAALEQLIDAKLALGRHTEVVGELESLIDEHPYRERLRAQLMLALYRCDRQADALQAYQDARRTLVDELGIEPGERLRDLERAILAQEPALAAIDHAAPEPAPPAAEGVRAARRLVSVVVADIAGSAELTELDPESMHHVLDRYSDVSGAVIERHGGTVEAYSGHAVVGVFGQAATHEDDSLRAVRAAVELRDAAAGLDLGVKLGVEAGEVFVGAGARGSRFAAGSAFTVAARLEGTAPDGEILLGETIYRLVHDAVRAERLQPMRAWRLLELEEGPVIARPPASAFVGRKRELDELRGAFAKTRDEQACSAVTVVGPAGLGKSRLAQELIAEIGEGATVLVGRCPSYGEAVTYRPLAEIVGQLAPGGDPWQRVSELLDGDDAMAQMVLGAIGLSDAPAQAEETFWAVRTMFERLAQRHPLVVVFEDVHWAEPTLLDLLDYLVAFLSGRAVLLVCLTRPELLESRPGWAAPRPNRSLIVLDALSDADARRLLENAGAGELGPRTEARIVETAEGNPLFLEQLAAVGAETGEDALPVSIQAVLAARIDRLEAGERALLEDASVQGRSFYVGPLEAATATRLISLVNKQLIRAERSELPGEDSFRFAHVLIREAAFRALPKQRRAELHEHVAGWVEERPGARDETVGFHLGEAYRYRAELGRIGEAEHALAGKAAERLAAAADAALLRGDPASGARLLEHAASLLEWYEAARGEVLPALGAALFEAGRLTDAMRVLDEAIADAPEPRLRARAQIERELIRLDTDTSAGMEPARRVEDAALGILERDGDEYGQCRAWLLRGKLAWYAGRVASADEAWSMAADTARRAGSRRELFEVIGWRATAAVLGPTPVDEAIGRCEEFREIVRASPAATASTLNPLALLHAMKGDFGVAERLLAQAGGILRELGGRSAGVSHLAASVRLLAAQPELAEAQLRTEMETLRATGEHDTLATTTALLAQAVYAQGRTAEAGELCRMAEQRAAEEDIITQAIWRGVAAKIHAREARCDEAEALAREAVALVEPTDLLSHRGDAMLDLAEVLRICERSDEADGATRAGHALYERKGNAAAARRLTDRPGGE